VFAIIRDVSYRFEQNTRMLTWGAITNDLLLVADTSIPVDRRSPKWVNAAWTRQLGWLPEELYEMRLVDVLDPAETAIEITQQAAIDQAGVQATVSCRVRCKPVPGQPQEYRYYEWVSQPLNNHIYVTGRDISKDRLHRIQMDKVIEDLETRNVDLERFASVTAHQLRSPPRTIAGIAQALREDYGHLLDGTGIQFLDDIRNDANQMADIVDGIYRFSKVRTSADLKLEPVNLQVLLTDLGQAAKREGDCPMDAKLIWHDLPVVLGEKVLLMEMFRNLIHNGCKFNNSQPKVVTVSAVPRTDERWDITVRDNGIGIDPQYLPKLFTMFERVHPEYPGTGVGLALVKAIVEKMGGQITLVSTPGEGTAFTFDLEAAWLP
jgi:signal transduction histidine kinase